MTTENFNITINEQFDKCKNVLITKAAEYATGDRLHNFKCAAGMMECSPQKALSGMMAKHTISIYDMCRSGQNYSMEQWDKKITDHINYLLLLKAIICDGYGVIDPTNKNSTLEETSDIIDYDTYFKDLPLELKKKYAMEMYNDGCLINKIANRIGESFLTVAEWVRIEEATRSVCNESSRPETVN